MSAARLARVALATVALLLCHAPLGASAAVKGLADDGGASWHLEQPAPPQAPPGVGEAGVPISLGRVGDIEFAPGMTNRGALITSGNPPTIEPGVWEFNGVSWRQLSTKCGAGDGRIVWSGPEEFWTISNGRPGQQANVHGYLPPKRDNTLCRFSNPEHKEEPLRIMESFAAPAFEADSYQAMNAGACLGVSDSSYSSDCWFAGDPLPAEGAAAGSFHLHWNGSELIEQPYPEEGYPVESMQAFENHLYESVRFEKDDRDESNTQAPLHVIEAEGASEVFEKLPWDEPPLEEALYEEGEFPEALDFLHLSASGTILWAAAGPQKTTPKGSKPAQVTIARDEAGGWQQVLGPETTAGKQPFSELTLSALAGEPDSEGAWFALDTPQDYREAISEKEEVVTGSANAYARVARISADGTLSAEDEQSLPTAEETGVGPKGAAVTMTCPGPHDCWLATSQGWLFHLATEKEREEQASGAKRDTDPAFETLITERPPDKGLPVVPPVTLAADDSGLLGELTSATSVAHEQTTKSPAERVTVPLLSHLHARIVHGSTLELLFQLAVKARLKLIAKRGKSVIASTPTRTLAAGNRSLQLRLNPKRWPTKLTLQSHPLAPLPTESLTASSETTVTTSELPGSIGKTLSGPLP